MNSNLLHSDVVSLKDEFIFSNELLSLINYRISLSLKDYELISLDDNYLLIKRDTLEWAFHIRVGKNIGFWNGNIFEFPISIFSINNFECVNYIVSNWIFNFMLEEKGIDINGKASLSDSYSNRISLINQILKFSVTESIIDSSSKYLLKSYWNNRPNFNRINNFNFSSLL